MAARDVQAFILRFRDLVTRVGDTIEHHREIANKRGTVWWGWWHKGGERVPQRVFKHLREDLELGPKAIYLLDSNRGWLYTAQLANIAWGSKEIPSPKPNATPEYYRTKKCLAWFEISELKKVSREISSLLGSFTYVRVDEFFEDNPRAYEAFNGKRLNSPSELIQQNRSIWFVRSVSATARPRGRAVVARHPRLRGKRGSIRTKSRVIPHFPKDPFPSKSNTFLWLSDLHFWQRPDREEEAKHVAELAVRLISAKPEISTKAKSKINKASAIAKQVAKELEDRLKDRIARNTKQSEASAFGDSLKLAIQKAMVKRPARASSGTTTPAYWKRLTGVLSHEVAKVFRQHVTKNGAKKEPESQHAFDNPVSPSKSPPPRKQLFTTIQSVLGVEKTGGRSRPAGPATKLAGVIVSGDLTWQSSREEFRQAHDFLDKLADPFDLARVDK